jgi:hypothetical protein
MKLIEVKAQDLSGLGGPMGTGEISTIRTEIFTREDKAIEWALEYAKEYSPGHYERHGIEDVVQKHRKNADEIKRALIDIGCIGFKFTPKRLR